MAWCRRTSSRSTSRGARGASSAAIPLATWRPKVFVIEVTQPTTDIPGQEVVGADPDSGTATCSPLYDGINRFYLRGDLADSLPITSDRPVNALDDYVTADTSENRERAETLQVKLDAERRRARRGRGLARRRRS